jgi:hypothetical protein
MPADLDAAAPPPPPGLTAAAILTRATEIKTLRVEVPEWGGAVFVRMMTAGERDRWDITVRNDAFRDASAYLVALTACDEAGNRLFRDDQVAELAALNGVAVERVATRALRLNRLRVRDREEIRGNSDGQADAP